LKADPLKWAHAAAARKRIFYLLYAGAWVCFFAYRLFPSQAVIVYLSDRIAVAAPGYSVAIGSLKPVFPPALRAKTVTLVHGQQKVLHVDELRIRPRLKGIFGLRPLFSFTGKAWGGSFEGRTEPEPYDSGKGLRLQMRFAGIALERIPRVRELTGHGISGSLGGRAALTTGGLDHKQMTAAVVIAGAVIDTPTPVMGVSRLRFDRVAADLALSEGNLSILQSSFDGPQINGRIGGTIAMRHPIGASRLDLEGSVRAHAEFLAQVQGARAIPSVLRKTIGEDGFSFRFSGTYAAPAVTLAPGPSGKRL
jgi:type II secretion system protein N